MVSELIASYENRISTVEELIAPAYQTTSSPDETLAVLDKEREALKSSLQEALARNCSLRRKDFNSLIDVVLSDSERKRGEIEQERKRVRDELREYLNGQKKIAVHLRRLLEEFMQGKGDKDKLDTAIREFKAACQDNGEEVFTQLRNFQLGLETFRSEQQEMNHKLQRLVSRGESLRIDDLRQLLAVKAYRERKVERELRREDVDRLLAHFRKLKKGGPRWESLLE